MIRQAFIPFRSLLRSKEIVMVQFFDLLSLQRFLRLCNAAGLNPWHGCLIWTQGQLLLRGKADRNKQIFGGDLLIAPFQFFLVKRGDLFSGTIRIIKAVADKVIDWRPVQSLFASSVLIAQYDSRTGLLALLLNNLIHALQPNNILFKE